MCDMGPSLCRTNTDAINSEPRLGRANKRLKGALVTAVCPIPRSALHTFPCSCHDQSQNNTLDMPLDDDGDDSELLAARIAITAALDGDGVCDGDDDEAALAAADALVAAFAAACRRGPSAAVPFPRGGGGCKVSGGDASSSSRGGREGAGGRRDSRGGGGAANDDAAPPPLFASVTEARLFFESLPAELPPLRAVRAAAASNLGARAARFLAWLLLACAPARGGALQSKRWRCEQQQ